MTRLAITASALLVLYAGGAQGGIIDVVTVGNPGNDPDTRFATPGFGGVSYVYGIAKFEVTAGQYTDFLNAVAATDTYGLYNDQMWSNPRGSKIERTGSPGSHTYSVASDWANRPVNFVSWGDAVRFANWMHNGQPTGLQDVSTTEDGSYIMNGATGDNDLWQFLGVTRNADATWVIPSESEWYKAAYHKNDGLTANYWDYPTSTNVDPGNDLVEPDPGNRANFRVGASDYTIGEPYWRTEIGEFENSGSPYGTLDQGGNVWEWNESIIDGLYRGIRGGSWDGDGTVARLHAQTRIFDPSPTDGADDIGFRLALVPEPSTVLLVISGMFVACRRRRHVR